MKKMFFLLILVLSCVKLNAAILDDGNTLSYSGTMNATTFVTTTSGTSTLTVTTANYSSTANFATTALTATTANLLSTYPANVVTANYSSSVTLNTLYVTSATFNRLTAGTEIITNGATANNLTVTATTNTGGLVSAGTVSANLLVATSFLSTNALQLSTVSAYSSPTRSFNTTVTPNASRSTFVVATFDLNCGNGDSSTIDVLVNGASLGNVINNFSVFGLLGVNGTLIIRQSFSFIVPPNQTYRFNNTGQGTETLSSVRELTL